MISIVAACGHVHCVTQPPYQAILTADFTVDRGSFISIRNGDTALSALEIRSRRKLIRDFGLTLTHIALSFQGNNRGFVAGAKPTINHPC
jgi:hypothetical protein